MLIFRPWATCERRSNLYPRPLLAALSWFFDHAVNCRMVVPPSGGDVKIVSSITTCVLHWFEKSALFFVDSFFDSILYIPLSMKFLRDFYFADLRFFEVSGNIGVRAREREGSTSSLKFWNFSGKVLMIQATADGVEIKLKKRKKKKTTLIPKHQAKWAMPNQGVWCQSSVNRWWKLVDYIHSFFPALSILSWNLWWELHLCVETVLRLLNPIIFSFRDAGVPRGKPSSRSTRLQTLDGENLNVNATHCIWYNQLIDGMVISSTDQLVAKINQFFVGLTSDFIPLTPGDITRFHGASIP